VVENESFRAKISAAVQDECIVVVDVQVKGSRGRPHVRAILDHRERGLTIDDCAAWSRRIEEVLDADPEFPRTYALDVMSPGVEHPLTEAWQFRKHAGREVQLNLHPEEGGEEERVEKGVIETVDDTHVNLAGGSSIPLAEIREGLILLPW
jgi:ribosome maturation factor RimP